MGRGLASLSSKMLILICASSAFAAKPAGKPAPKLAAATASAAAVADGDGPMESEPTTPTTAKHDPEILNRAEMLSLLKRYAREIADAMVDGEKTRAEAVRQRDAIKLACIQDRLSGMKLAKAMGDERLAASERPAIRADELNLRHEFRGVEMARTKVIELHRELLECVGEGLEVTTPDGKSSAPTSASSTDPAGTSIELPKMERPAPASPSS